MIIMNFVYFTFFEYIFLVALIIIFSLKYKFPLQRLFWKANPGHVRVPEVPPAKFDR